MATDSAFTQAGKKAGLESWRIEDLQPVAVPTADLHKLHSGDSYIFLKTSEATTYETPTQWRYRISWLTLLLLLRVLPAG
jgi:hypothetical protein